MKTKPVQHPTTRVWKVTDIPQPTPQALDWIEVEVRYREGANVAQAEQLDRFVVPLFKLAPELLDLVIKHVPREELSPQTQALITKLAGKPLQQPIKRHGSYPHTKNRPAKVGARRAKRHRP